MRLSMSVVFFFPAMGANLAEKRFDLIGNTGLFFQQWSISGKNLNQILPHGWTVLRIHATSCPFKTAVPSGQSLGKIKQVAPFLLFQVV